MLFLYHSIPVWTIPVWFALGVFACKAGTDIFKLARAEFQSWRVRRQASRYFTYIADVSHQVTHHGDNEDGNRL